MQTSIRHRREPLPASENHRMTAPAGAISLPALIRAEGLSTSGNSANVIAAIEAARTIGIVTIGMTGTNGGRMDDLCDIPIKVPATRTNRIQEMHIAVGHMLCGFAEDALC